MTDMSIKDKESISPSYLGQGVLIKVLQPLKSNSPVRPAIFRDMENSLSIYLKVYPGLLKALSLEDNKSGKRVAIGTNTLNDRDPFPIARLYRKSLLFCSRNKYFGIISNAFHEAFLIHVVLVLI